MSNLFGLNTHNGINAIHFVSWIDVDEENTIMS